MSNGKVRVSKNQFAEVLYFWISDYLTKKEVRAMAKALHFRVWSGKSLTKLSQELLLLNMWITVYTCERVILLQDSRNKCLDMFHRLIYERHIDKKKISFDDWMMWVVAPRCLEYSKAMETEHPSGPLWVVATKFNENLFGNIREDPFSQFRLMAHIGLFIEHLGTTLIDRYDIETK